MTFKELEQMLPNGFHDAKIQQVTIAYAEHSATIVMHISFGTPESANPDEYRQGTLRIDGLCYFAVDPPDPTYPFLGVRSPINVSGYPEDPAKFAVLKDLLSVMPNGVTCYRFFVHEWNSFVHIAAKDVRISWAENEGNNRS
jgi:hypothetical protein